MDAVRWYVRRSQGDTKVWVVCNCKSPGLYDNHYYIDKKGRTIQNCDHHYRLIKNITFSTRKAARAALRCYHTKWFGFYAKHWDRKIQRS